MSDYDSAALQRAVTDDSTELDQRDVRALTEFHSFLSSVGRVRGADDLFLLVSESGSEYLVDRRTKTCECPDHQHRGVRCKHLRRVAFATGERPIPAWANAEAVDPQLGEHLDGGPRVATADGGATDADANTDAENEGCLCETTELGCFEHFEVDSE